MHAPSASSRKRAEKLTRSALANIGDIGQLSLSDDDAYKIKQALMDAAKLMEFHIRVSNERIHFSFDAALAETEPQ